MFMLEQLIESDLIFGKFDVVMMLMLYARGHRILRCLSLESSNQAFEYVKSLLNAIGSENFTLQLWKC